MSTTLAEWLQHSKLPRNEARMLLQHICGLSHAQTITQSEHTLSPRDLTALNQAALRRCQGEPMAYILGQRAFYGHLFHVSPAVLIPRPETEHLVEAALAKLPPQGHLWDLGTGSGAIAISTACARPDATIWASDISAQALAIARHNAHHLGAHVRFGLGSWFDAHPQPQAASIDVVVSNPPYIDVTDAHLQQGDLRFEPRSALTDFGNGLSALATLIQHAPRFLKCGGWLLMEHGYQQGSAVQHLLSQQRYHHIHTLVDLAGLDRVTMGQWLA